MKKVSGIIIVLVFFSSFAADLSAKKNSPTSKGVYLYTKPNYKGFVEVITIDSRQLSTSSYKTSPRTAYVNFDNSVSSIRLVGINNIAVFTHSDFRGNCETITGDVPNLNRTSIGNDTITSLKVNSRCAPSGPTVTLYDQKDFRGRSVVINGDVPDLKVSNFLNKTASIKLTNVRSIAVFKKTHYQGKCMTINRDTFSLAGREVGLNSIASIKINSECSRLMELTVHNKSGFLAQVVIPEEGTRGKKEIVSGLKKKYFFNHGKSIFVLIKVMQPISDLAPLPAWKQVCHYRLTMDANHLITVKGSIFKRVTCNHVALKGQSR